MSMCPNVWLCRACGAGGATTFVHLRPEVVQSATLRAWISQTLPELMRLPDVVAAHAWEIAPGEPASPTTALTVGGATNRPVHWVVAIETTEPAAADVVRTALLEQDPTAHGATEIAAYPSYQLLFAQTGP